MALLPIVRPVIAIPSRVMFAAGMKFTPMVGVAPGSGASVTIPGFIAPWNVP